MFDASSDSDSPLRGCAHGWHLLCCGPYPNPLAQLWVVFDCSVRAEPLVSAGAATPKTFQPGKQGLPRLDADGDRLDVILNYST